MGLGLRILHRTGSVGGKWFGSGSNSDFEASTVDGTPSEAESRSSLYSRMDENHRRRQPSSSLNEPGTAALFGFIQAIHAKTPAGKSV
jgi:hypothetical protein